MVVDGSSEEFALNEFPIFDDVSEFNINDGVSLSHDGHCLGKLNKGWNVIKIQLNVLDEPSPLVTKVRIGTRLTHKNFNLAHRWQDPGLRHVHDQRD